MNSPIHHLAYEYRSSVLPAVAVGLNLFLILRCLYIHRNHRETKPKIESHEIEKVMPALISNKKNHKRTSKYGGSNQCAICLEEIKDGECSRLFPKCNHEFHRTCIDTWLMLHKYTCPVCRNSLEEEIFSISGDDLV
ncbi:E3 ubiquitin-protein ligase ATL76-like [Quercus lobata]|nr:E3 ubiquitin-protein ligase ATL76-like [Quercus lobata]